MKDPLCDSKSTLAMFREYCSGVEIKEIDAGNFTAFLFYVSSFDSPHNPTVLFAYCYPLYSSTCTIL